MKPKVEPAAFGPEGAAAYLNVSRGKIYLVLRASELRAAKIGGRTLIRRVDLDALLERAVASGVFS